MKNRISLFIIAISLLIAPLMGEGTANTIDNKRFKSIIIYSGSRAMPFDTFSRLVVRQLSGKNDINKKSASYWMWQHMVNPESTALDKVFLIDSPETLMAMGIDEGKRGRFTYEELEPYYPFLQEKALELSKRDSIDRIENELVLLENNINLYVKIAGFFDFYRPHPDLILKNDKINEFLQYPQSLNNISAFQLLKSYREIKKNGIQIPHTLLNDMNELISQFISISQLYDHVPVKILPKSFENKIQWISPWEISGQTFKKRETPLEENLFLLMSQLEIIFIAASNNNEEMMLQATHAYESNVNLLMKLDNMKNHSKLEVLINGFNPFLISLILLIVSIIFQLLLSERLKRFYAYYTTLTAFTIFSFGLISRIIITGRPPVTDIESSFLFVAWVFIILAIWLVYKKNERTGYILTAITTISLIVFSKSYSLQFDQFGEIQAVLDTNFWLTVHVLTISLGYTGVLASGVFAHIYMFRKVFLPYKYLEIKKSYSIMFALLAIGLIFTFLGTMLGGVWADQSWGRFWGWDPKENGALLIILWVSIIFHGKLGRIIGADGFAATTIIAIPVVLFSWIGVNMLGVGLHSYGFISEKLFLLVLFSIFEFLIAISMLIYLNYREKNQSFDTISIKVTSKEKIHNNVFLINLQLQNELDFIFIAGQYITIFLDINGIVYKRSYSIVSTPEEFLESKTFSILVKEENNGKVSPYMTKKLSIGEKLSISKASGDFKLQKRKDTHVFLAGGIGIAPIISLLKSSLMDKKSHNILFYSSSTLDRLYLKKDLDLLEEKYKNLKIHYTLTKEDQTSNEISFGRLEKGTIEKEIDSLHKCAFYPCGSDSFVHYIHDELNHLKIEPSSIHKESFSPTVERNNFLSSQKWNIEFRKEAKKVIVVPGQSILEAALKSNIQINHSCLSGHCGDCKIKHKSGKVVSLSKKGITPLELEEGYILSCNSFADEDLLIE